MSFEQHLLNSLTGHLWKTIGLKERHGIAIPLFALRSQNGHGVGTFYDLLPLIDWCHSLNLSIIQLLPFADSGLDSSPYNALSSCAIDPVYLSLETLPNLNDDLKNKLFALKKFNSSKRLMYPELKQEKLKWLWDYFLFQESSLADDTIFQNFLKENEWLPEYALFRTFKELFNNSSWQDWPQEFQNIHDLAPHLKQHSQKVLFYSYLQYLAYSQLKKVKEASFQKGVFLCADIPYSLSPDSTDVWFYKNLFDFKYVAGAPPDLYNKKGQKWGFPIFNFITLENTDFRWWKRRVEQVCQYAHLFRLDHVVGFFRIWAIPFNKKAKKGKFLPENRQEWALQGEKFLHAIIAASSALPIAEDLGTIPDEVFFILHDLGICGTKIMRWMRDWEGDKHFLSLNAYDPLSMTSISNHDLEPLQEWWRKHRKDAKALAKSKEWSYSRTISPEQHKALLWDSHHTASIFHINPLQEYLALFPELHWDKLSDERINIPGKILSTNWTYRLRPTLEELTAHEGLKKLIQELTGIYSIGK